MKHTAAPSVVRRFLRTYVPGHLGLYAVGLAFLLATTAVMLIIPKVIGQIIDQLGMAGVTVETVRPTIVRLMILAGLLFGCRAFSRVVLFYPGRKIEQSIRQDFFDRLTHLPQALAQRFTVGDMMSRGVNDVTAIRVMVSMAILHVVNTAVLGAGALHGMATLSPRLTAWVMLPLLGMFVTTTVAVRAIYRSVRQAQETLGDLSESVRETLGAYPIFNTVPVGGALVGRFDVWNQQYSAAVQRVATARACIFPLMSTFVGLGVLLVLWRGGRMVITGELALGSLVAFMTYVWILADPAVAIGWVVNALQRGHSALVRLYDVMDAKGPEAPPARVLDQEPVRQLQVDALRFRYPARGGDRNGGPFELSIDHIDLRAGQRLGVFGPTGSGKSTFASVLAGVLEAPPGTIRLNGHDQRHVAPAVWRQWVSYVPQQTTLFSTSIEENIQMAGTLDLGRLTEAIAVAELGAEVASFPQGLRTQVGEAGVTLSGGQRQRVSFARALYHAGGLMILDDMTSAVDLVTEAKLLRNIRERLTAVMLVLISHRVSTLEGCDEILLLDHGRIVDRGPHAELVKRHALYRATWEYERRAREHSGMGDDR